MKVSSWTVRAGFISPVTFHLIDIAVDKWESAATFYFILLGFGVWIELRKKHNINL